MSGAGALFPGHDSLFLDTLLSASHTLVMGHFNPDGDSLGSSVALYLALESLGRKVTLGYQGRIHGHLAFLLNGVRDCRLIEATEKDLSQFDLAVIVDCLQPDRIWEGMVDQDLLPPILIVDHHPGQEHIFKPIAKIHSPEVSSAGELMFKVIEALNVPLTRSIAEALMVALMSDTGFFSQNNSTSESFRQASVLVAHGARSEYLAGCLKRNWTQARVRLLAAALGTLEITFDGHLASMLLTQAMLEETGANLDDMDGFVEYPRSMSGVEVAVLFRVDGQGHTRVSLRSDLHYNVQEVAEHFGGGGHRQAAAYTDPSGDPAQARERFLSQAIRYLKPR
ncbi:MAG: bifunctional oligoribonuclease/PAP phosphatase NrnA [Deltaproteobacteria bacterium]|jgi:phosphoesterase RecJ-like protein|nr:bifunctional oligoribonuclease/PAP phosphatase NrnA [Deltaproteobacteria bacterium]